MIKFISNFASKYLKKIKTTEESTAILVMIFAAVILVAYGIFKFADYSNNIDIELKNKASYVSDLSSLILKEPVWNYDMETVKSIVTALYKDKEIQLIELKNIDNSIIYEGKEKTTNKNVNKNLIIVNKALIKNDIDEVGRPIDNQLIGNVEIGITKYYKEKRLIKEFINSTLWILMALLFAYYPISVFLRQEKKGKERISSILNNMADSVIAVDENLEILSCNQATEKLFGYNLEKLIGNNLTVLIKLDKDCEKINEIYSIDNFRDYINKEIVGLRNDQTEVPIEFNMGTININNKNIYIFVIRDITQRNEINRVKNEFVSIVSHELRTPLTSIIGSLSFIINDIVKDPNKQKELLSMAHRNSYVLLTLINNILDVDKLEQNKMKFDIQPLNINEVFNNVINENAVLLQNGNLTLNFNPLTDGIQILADTTRLAQVITNLLSNAIKFSNKNGEINIFMEVVEDIVRVHIKDNGVGIGEEYREKIFDKFVQADSSDTRQKGGSGLGLTICKNIIKKMNGNIDFKSEPGIGSDFYFDLPIAREPNVVTSGS